MALKKKTSKAGKGKPAAKAVPKKKAVLLRKKAETKVSQKKPAGSKSTIKAAPARRPVAKPIRPSPAPKAVAAPTPRAEVPVKDADAPKVNAKPVAKKDLEFFRKLLLNLRDRIVDEIAFLAGENLNNSQREASGDLSNYGMHMADQGTDNFEREFALSLVSNEQEVLYEIDDALHRIDNNAYGICELTGRQIETERLKVLPYARYCREAQEQMEKNRKRFRPFVSAPSQGQGSSSQEF